MIIPEASVSSIEVFAVNHHYSCGGYWLAKVIGDAGEVWRISPAFGTGAVMSEQQVKSAVAAMEARIGKPVFLRWLSEFPSEEYQVINK